MSLSRLGDSMLHDIILDKNVYPDRILFHHNSGDDDMARVWYGAGLWAAGEKPQIFYFNRNHIDNDLIDTGHEFYREGILKFPFDNCMFVIDNAIDDSQIGQSYLTKYMREAYLFRKIASLPDGKLKEDISKCKFPENFKAEYAFMQFTEMCIEGKIRAIPNVNFIFLADSKHHGQYGSVASFCIFPAERITTEDAALLKQNAIFSIGTIVGALMLLNTKYAKKTEHKIDEKLNKNRIKNGKEPLCNYITVGLAPNKHFDSGSGTHARPKAHWRRGHIRRLEDKVVAVQPCLVNWDGDPNEIQKKIYVV